MSNKVTATTTTAGSNGRRRLKWNFYDVVMLVPTAHVTYLKILLTIRKTAKLKLLANWNFGYFPLQNEASIYSRSQDLIGLLIFLNLMKTFKYFKRNLILDELIRAITGCISHALSFLVMFCTIFLAFAFWAFLLFGAKLPTYNTVTKSSFALFEIVLGECDYTQFTNSNRLWGPLFFIQYVCFVFFVLINVFVAIVNESYVFARDFTQISLDPHNLGLFSDGNSLRSENRRIPRPSVSSKSRWTRIFAEIRPQSPKSGPKGRSQRVSGKF